MTAQPTGPDFAGVLTQAEYEALRFAMSGPTPLIQELRLISLINAAKADALAECRSLAEKWNATPDYTPSDYDKGRVDQRHAMTEELLTALAARVQP